MKGQKRKPKTRGSSWDFFSLGGIDKQEREDTLMSIRSGCGLDGKKRTRGDRSRGVRDGRSVESCGTVDMWSGDAGRGAGADQNEASGRTWVEPASGGTIGWPPLQGELVLEPLGCLA
jgi:hypothetical protein